jgi:hypothetical protein
MMAEFRDRTFTGGEQVETDENRFVNCTFESASLRFAGGTLPQFENCTFGEIGWHFTGPALRTIQILQALNDAPPGAVFIADLFAPGKFISE